MLWGVDEPEKQEKHKFVLWGLRGKSHTHVNYYNIYTNTAINFCVLHVYIYIYIHVGMTFEELLDKAQGEAGVDMVEVKGGKMVKKFASCEDLSGNYINIYICLIKSMCVMCFFFYVYVFIYG